ncbi:putative transposase, partial [Alicyclobacillus tolerans]
MSEATYYHRLKHQGEPRVYNGGRPKPGYSLCNNGKPVSDEQMKEWLLEAIAGDEASYGYRKLTVYLR